MADDKPQDTPQSSSHPFFTGGQFPFVFLPSGFTTDFNLNNPAHVSTNGDQPTTESQEKKEKDENSEEIEKAETVDDDDDDHNDEKNDLRISQPKYSQLLKDLDFSRTRMVDVTNLLADELEQENEHPRKPLNDENYQSLSSVSSDEGLDDQTSTTNQNEPDDHKANERKVLTQAADEIEADLYNLAAIINQASQGSIGKRNEDEENSEHINRNLLKGHTFDEDDDTSKQATQDYDLHDNEQEDRAPSSKSSKIPRLISQHSKSIISSVKLDNETAKEETEEGEKQRLPTFTWESLLDGTEPVQSPGELISQPTIKSHSTPKKTPEQKQPSSPFSSEDSFKQRISLPVKEDIPYQPYQKTASVSSEESSKRRISPPPKQNIPQQSYQTTSSSDSDPIVKRIYHQPTPEPPKQLILPVVPSQTLRQDSQSTLIDDNLDDLSSQLKQVLLDHERQTVSNSTREERTIDGLGSMSFPFSIPNISSTDVLENKTSNRVTDDLLRRFPDQQRQRISSNIPERSTSQRKKSHHYHQKSSTSRSATTNSRQTDDNWLTMLERLEREHKTRLEKQQQQYEDYMHDLEEKMKRRFDDYLTLTNGFQESILDSYDDTMHNHRLHSSIPIDSNIDRYKTHSHEHQYRPLAEDLISRYYPADSTLNVLSNGKKRSPESTALPRSPTRDNISNVRTHLSGRHADSKLDYDSEINGLKNQLARTRMGHTSSTTRQSIETIERINNENIRLRDEMNELRHSLKITGDENILLKRQVEELREQLSSKDLDLKTYHRTIADLEQQLSKAENTKERQTESSRRADRQVFFHHEENEKIKTDLNLTRERLLRLEERYREQEKENETLRRQVFTLENDSDRIKNRMTDDYKLSSTMALNVPTSREYGRFTLSTTGQNLSSPISSPREIHINSGRYQSTATENLLHHTHSPRPMTRISDYLNDKPIFPQAYVPPSRHVYSPRRPSPNRRRVEPMSTRNSIDRQTRQTEQLEQKCDQLLKKKRDLEARLSRIPLRGLTTTDRQLSDVLEREIDRVEQQISSIKLELRKFNVVRIY